MAYNFRRIIDKVKNLHPRKSKSSDRYIGANLSILPGDSFLVSYPKSGNTWLRFLIANLICGSGETVSFRNIEKLVPDIYRNTDKQLLKISRPRILKSHELYQANYMKIIYIVRDPRDVAVSYYHHLIKANKISESTSIESFAPEFLEGRFHPKFGNWMAHVHQWLDLVEEHQSLLLVKYEDLIEDTSEVLKDIAIFLNIDFDEKSLRTAIENSHSDRLRQLEIAEKWQPFDGEMKTDRRFVRSATSGNWKKDLPISVVQGIEAEWGEAMKKLNYN